MDENKDVVSDEPTVEDAVDEPAEGALEYEDGEGESAEEAAEAAAGESAGNTAEDLAADAVDEDASPAVEDVDAAIEDAASGEEAVVAPEDAEADDEALETDPESESADGAEAPVAAAPAEPAKKSSFATTGDLLIVGILALIMGVLLALPSFLGATSGEEKAETASGAAAATVNGVVISEDEVTKYVMDFRSQQSLESDDAWGEWMVGYGYTPEALRDDTIDYFVNRELLKQAIAEQGVEVEDGKVEEYIASIAEQVGGEEAFQNALEQEGLDLETYRSEILFSLQQQALAEKVAPVDDRIDDAQVLEVVKMYFPDSVDKNAKSLDDVDDEVVEEVRSMLKSSALQQAFSQWMEDYRSKANIVIVDMPASLPYVIDLAPYEEKAKQAAQDGALVDPDEAEDIEDAEDAGDEGIELVLDDDEGADSAEDSESDGSASAQ